MTHEQLVDLLRKTFPDAGPESLTITTACTIGGGLTYIAHYLTARHPLVPVPVQHTLRGSDAEVRDGAKAFAKEVAGFTLSREMADVLIGLGM